MRKKSTNRARTCGLITAACFLYFSGAAQDQNAGKVAFAASTGVVAQSTSTKSLNDVLKDLRSKYGIQYSYKADVAKNLQLQVPAGVSSEANVEVVLAKVLAPSGLTYKKVNNVYIIIKDVAPAPAVTPSANRSSAVQEQTVRGTVTDGSGSPLPGVTVVVKGTTRGTSTDASGNFTLAVPANATLVLSYIGFQTKEVAVGNQATFNISLQTDAKALEEVVVIGYGTQKKSDVTGAVTSVTSEDFVQGQNTTPEQLIQGKVAGVQITTNGGAPGSGSRIRIRGGASLTASNDPLIVIDGVPVDNAATSGAANPLNFLNPNDIESFNVLKDASATAIYGSRASNGVIIITTKKGKAGQKFSVNFSTQNSLSVINDKIDVLSADEFRAVVNERGSEAQRALLGTENTDWQDLIYRNAITTDNNVSVSGAYKFLPYRVSFGYLNQEGVIKTSEFERYSGGISLNPTFFNDHLTVNLNYKGAKTNSRFADQGAIGAAVAFDPTQPVRVDNEFGGYFQWLDANGRYNPLATRNPLSMLEQRRDVGDAYRSIGNVQLDYKFHFLPELRANLNIGFDRSESDGSTVTRADFAPDAVTAGRRTQFEQTKTNELFDFYLNYVKELEGFNSRIDATAGYSFQDFENDRPNFVPTNAAGVPLTDQEPGLPLNQPYKLKSYFGRINYSLMDRYLLTATVRYDGSTRFSEDNRWGTFPALALAWRINEEAFLASSAVVSDMKLRLGFGVTGQQDIGERFFPYLARYSYSDNTAQYQLGDEFYNLYRPEGYDTGIKWEETRTWNAGLDFGFLNNRITGSLDYFFKDTKDLLALVAVPAGTNLTNELVTNVGNLETQGVEAVLNFTAIDTEKLTWNIGLNGTYQNREITSLSKVENPDFEGYPEGGILGGTGNRIQINSVGYAPNTFFVYKQVYDSNGKPIEGLYADLNEDGVINEKDKYRYKNPEPNVFLGINSDVRYGNWNLSFVARGSFGNYMYNNVYSNLGAYRAFTFPGYLTNVSTNVNETNFQEFQLFSDYYMENASFLRMENISLGYDFGRLFDETLAIRLTANMQNAFVITKYDGLDPEIAGGIDNNFYPRPRVYTLGLNIGF
ncbi:TonB-dependent receptor [uncultured Pontibacter sp.]|uniref:SusC/RagA family TonB-linked outer membrane protein n=1 Tax=uncultured Pontibacter sp. TaxID=453356 RepID=UPI002620B1B3|nr:TonB-dependent receptor [uncultured Pontibacter sp.]